MLACEVTVVVCNRRGGRCYSGCVSLAMMILITSLREKLAFLESDNAHLRRRLQEEQCRALETEKAQSHLDIRKIMEAEEKLKQQVSSLSQREKEYASLMEELKSLQEKYEERENVLRIANERVGQASKLKSLHMESRGNVEEARAGVKMNAEDNVQEEEEVQKPNMGLSGKLTEDTNTYNGVVIKYSQPPEARNPREDGDECLPHRQRPQSCRHPTDHPSCSKQHAVLQYRLVTYNREDGTKGRTVKPYILDLESANGTYVNNRRIEPRRYVELLEKDVVKFGYSSREYILLHEGSKGEDRMRLIRVLTLAQCPF
ncbi:putative smad nuclear-interacting protein 1 [Penaeus vannamei]|uniref:Putative smad nuclear-interacting protein 1 n=1 Tax=Penaeus vannamei TaxID=6689 RepID=A0A3R7P6P3_PENVA|nr:putative smad nuclear-interacting protein 1 [Penaeus vannamei]